MKKTYFFFFVFVFLTQMAMSKEISGDLKAKLIGTWKWSVPKGRSNEVSASGMIKLTEDDRYLKTYDRLEYQWDKKLKKLGIMEEKGTYNIYKNKAFQMITESGMKYSYVPPKFIDPDTVKFDEYVWVRMKADEKSEGKTEEIRLGMTEEDVLKTFGEPDKKAILGEKTIFKYKDMTVTFLAGKVSDVQFN